MTNPPLNGERAFLCPRCNGGLRVVDSRPASIFNRQSIRRRRVCTVCPHKFTTFEINADEMERANLMQSKLKRIADIAREMPSPVSRPSR